MNLEDFLTQDPDVVAPDPKPLNTKSWRAQIERVLDVYIRECERYRREHKALAEQVNEMAKVISDLRAR